MSAIGGRAAVQQGADGDAAYRALRNQRRQETTAFRTVLAAIPDLLIRRLVSEHQPLGLGPYPECAACEPGEMGVGWPCPTVQTIADHYDIDVPENVVV